MVYSECIHFWLENLLQTCPNPQQVRLKHVPCLQDAAKEKGPCGPISLGYTRLRLSRSLTVRMAQTSTMLMGSVTLQVRDPMAAFPELSKIDFGLRSILYEGLKFCGTHLGKR